MSLMIFWDEKLIGRIIGALKIAGRVICGERVLLREERGKFKEGKRKDFNVNFS